MNDAHRQAHRAFIRAAADFLQQRIHNPNSLAPDSTISAIKSTSAKPIRMLRPRRSSILGNHDEKA